MLTTDIFVNDSGTFLKESLEFSRFNMATFLDSSWGFLGLQHCRAWPKAEKRIEDGLIATTSQI